MEVTKVAVSNTSFTDLSEYLLNITKVIKKVVPDAINLQLIAFIILLTGLSFSFPCSILKEESSTIFIYRLIRLAIVINLNKLSKVFFYAFK